MAIDKLTSDQLKEVQALSEIAPSANTALNTILSNVDSKVKVPASLSVTGSSLILTIGTTSPVTGPSSKKKGLAPLGSSDLSNLSGTFNLSNGSITGDAQSASMPTMSAGFYIRIGIEIKSDQKFYLAFGAESVSSSLAGLPAFSTGSMPIGEILLQDNGTGGVGNFLNPAMGAVTQYDVGGGGAGGSFDVNDILVNNNGDVLTNSSGNVLLKG